MTSVYPSGVATALSDQGRDAFLFPEISRPSHARTTSHISCPTTPTNPTAPKENLSNPNPNLKREAPPAVNLSAAPSSFVNVLMGNSTGSSKPNPSTDATKVQDIGGGFRAVKISQSVYDSRVEACKYSVIGRITLAKGDTPWKHLDLKLKLNTVWGLNMNWKLISLGKGFFHVIFTSQSDLNSAWSRGALALKPGILRLTSRTPGIDPKNQKTTTAHVWVRVCNLPWEFWDRRIISDIARVIGVPLRFDRNTVEGEFGHYARVLVDMDLSKQIQHEIRVDTDDLMVWVQLFYENIPGFCSSCNSVGHITANCRRNRPAHDNLGKGHKCQKTNGTNTSQIIPAAEKGTDERASANEATNPEIDKPVSTAEKPDGHLEQKQLVVYQRCRSKATVPLKKVFDMIIDDTTRTTSALQTSIDDAQLRRWRNIAARTAEAVSPFKDPSSLVKETPQRQPWSSDSEGEPIRGFIPSDPSRTVLFHNIIDPLAHNEYDVRPLPEDMEDFINRWKTRRI